MLAGLAILHHRTSVSDGVTVQVALLNPSRGQGGDLPRHGSFVASFPRGKLDLEHQDANIDYDLDPTSAEFYVNIPGSYAPSHSYGVLVCMYPGGDITSEPAGWAPVLEQQRLLFIAPLYQLALRLTLRA